MSRLHFTYFVLPIVWLGCGGKTFESGSSSGGTNGDDGGPGGTNAQGGATAQGGSDSGQGGASTGAAGSTSTGVGGSVGATTGSGGGAAGGSSGAGQAGRAGSAGSSSGGGGATGSGGASTGGAAGSGGMGAADGGTTCPGTSCGLGFICCNSACVNPNNDILNCGQCGQKCDGPNPFCAGGSCGQPPCLRGALCPDMVACCGTQCCSAGQLCCDVPGPGPSLGPRCTDPVGGTCPGGCPACICAAPDTPVATPAGTQPIAALRAGDVVYSVVHGHVAPVPIRRIRRVPAHNHTVTRLVLANGEVLEISAVHPTADGRTIGALRDGDELDGVRVKESRTVPYGYDATYDILPDSDSGAYFAGGVLIGSTLAGADAVEVSYATAPACE